MGGSGSKEKSPSSSGKSGSSKKSRKRSNKSSSSSSPPPTPSSPTAPVGGKPSAPPHPINNVKGMARSGLPAQFVSSPRKVSNKSDPQQFNPTWSVDVGLGAFLDTNFLLLSFFFSPFVSL